MNIFDRVKNIVRGAETIREWLSDDGATADPREAQSRADACLNCPLNQPGGKIEEVTANAIKRHLEVKKHLGLRVKGEKSLNECKMCGCQIRLKIWVPIHIVKKHLTDREIGMAPQHCWQTK